MPGKELLEEEGDSPAAAPPENNDIARMVKKTKRKICLINLLRVFQTIEQPQNKVLLLILLKKPFFLEVIKLSLIINYMGKSLLLFIVKLYFVIWSENATKLSIIAER